MQVEQRGNTLLKIILTHSLGDGVRPILEWAGLSMGPFEVLFFQMQPNLISLLELVWNSMLIVALLILSIGFFAKYHALVVGCDGFG